MSFFSDAPRGFADLWYFKNAKFESVKFEKKYVLSWTWQYWGISLDGLLLNTTWARVAQNQQNDLCVQQSLTSALHLSSLCCAIYG